MNTHDIELPEPKYPGTKANIPNAIPDLYTADQVRAAIDPYAKRIAELEADRKRRGEPVGRFTGRFTGEVNGDALFVVKAYGAIPAPGAELYTAPQPADPRSTHQVHRGAESLPCYCDSDLDHQIGQETQPAEPVKVPSKLSNAEILSLAYDVGAMPEQATDATLVRFARALLARYTTTKEQP